MSSPQQASTIVAYDDVPPEPWANGLGLTRVVTTHGPDSGPFTWRLSLAELTASCPFSALPDVDRILTLASAGPVDLIIDGASQRLIRGQQVAFPGEAATAVSLPAGPQVDLNLMLRRSAADGRIDVLTAASRALDPSAGVVAAVVLDGEARLSDGRSLGKWATLLIGSAAETMDATSATVAIVSVRTQPTVRN